MLKHTRTHTTVTRIPRQRRSTKMFAYVFYLYISSFDRVCEVLRKSKEWRGNARGARFYSGSEGTSSVAVGTFGKKNISTAPCLTPRGGNRPENARKRSRCHSLVVPCPFLRALRLFTSLVTTLGVALVNSLEGLKPLFFPCIFSPFSSFRVFRNATLPHFERFACAGREEKLLKKQATYDPTNSVVCKSSDHVSGGTTRASPCARISHLLKIRSSLFFASCFRFGRPIFAFSAYASHLYSYSRDPSFAE